MREKIIKRERTLCTCCMEEHEVLTVRVNENTVYKGVPVDFEAIYNYCENAGEYFESGDMIGANKTAMMDEYHRITNI